MQVTAGVAEVVYDAASRRYEGQVYVFRNGSHRKLRVSAAGHPQWTHTRIRDALIAASARNPVRPEARHAGV